MPRFIQTFLIGCWILPSGTVEIAGLYYQNLTCIYSYQNVQKNTINDDSYSIITECMVSFALKCLHSGTTKFTVWCRTTLFGENPSLCTIICFSVVHHCGNGYSVTSIIEVTLYSLPQW